MDAWLRLCVVGALTLSGLNTAANFVDAATYRTPNFLVHAADADFARDVGEAAEMYRRELSISWTGKVMPKWSAPCPIHIKTGQIGAGGSTTFHFDNGEVYGWKMNVQGTQERILDSVLPHEINHTIFACYFRRPLPRWADEGAASMIEHESERLRLQKIAQEAARGSRKIPLANLLAMKQYPTDQRAVLSLYAEAYTLTNFLIQRGGKETYLKFLKAAHDRGWESAFQAFYGIDRLPEFEQNWDKWVLAGCPEVDGGIGYPFNTSEMLAGQFAPAERGTKLASDAIVRGQSGEGGIAGRGEKSSGRDGQPQSVTPELAAPVLALNGLASNGAQRTGQPQMAELALVADNREGLSASGLAQEIDVVLDDGGFGGISRSRTGLMEPLAFVPADAVGRPSAAANVAKLRSIDRPPTAPDEREPRRWNSDLSRGFRE